MMLSNSTNRVFITLPHYESELAALRKIPMKSMSQNATQKPIGSATEIAATTAKFHIHINGAARTNAATKRITMTIRIVDTVFICSTVA